MGRGRHRYKQTSRLLDRIGPVGRIGEKTILRRFSKVISVSVDFLSIQFFSKLSTQCPDCPYNLQYPHKIVVVLSTFLTVFEVFPKKTHVRKTLNLSMCAEKSTDTKKGSGVRCHLSHVICHMSCVTSHLSHVTNTNSHSHKSSPC